MQRTPEIIESLSYVWEMTRTNRNVPQRHYGKAVIILMRSRLLRNFYQVYSK